MDTAHQVLGTGELCLQSGSLETGDVGAGGLVVTLLLLLFFVF